MNKEEFTKQILLSENSMYRIAKSILHQDEDCADAMQNAILHAYSELAGLKHEQYFRTWLTRILINECYSILRKRKPFLSYEDVAEKEKAGSSESYSEVYLEIEALEERYRIPFVLHYIEGFSVKEVASLLHKSEACIKMRLMRARNLLKQKLSDE